MSEIIIIIKKKINQANPNKTGKHASNLNKCVVMVSVRLQ